MGVTWGSLSIGKSVHVGKEVELPSARQPYLTLLLPLQLVFQLGQRRMRGLRLRPDVGIRHTGVEQVFSIAFLPMHINPEPQCPLSFQLLILSLNPSIYTF